MLGGRWDLVAARRLPGAGAITPKIVGGTAVPNGTYKFQAALPAQSLGNNDFQRQYCGGGVNYPDRMREAKVPITSRAECQTVHTNAGAPSTPPCSVPAAPTWTPATLAPSPPARAGRRWAGRRLAPAGSFSAMWEYAIREYVQEWGEQDDRSMASFLAELNRLGEDGWEAVGITPRTHYDRGGGPGGWDSFTFVVLLKRLRPADDLLPRS